VNILNKQSWTDERIGPPAWRFDEGLTTLHQKQELITEVTHGLGIEIQQALVNMVMNLFIP